MYRRLLGTLLVLSFLFSPSVPMALAASGEDRVQEFLQEKQYLLSQLRKIDRKAPEYTEKRRRYQIISRKLRTLLKSKQVKRERPQLVRSSSLEIKNEEKVQITTKPAVIRPTATISTTKKKRIHPIKLKRTADKAAIAAKNTEQDTESTEVISTELGEASYYAEFFNGRTTASGTIFSNEDMTAAHRTLKFGTRVRVTNVENGKSLELEITDRGPYAKGRIIDLTREAFSRLDNISRGVMPVKVEVLSIP